MAVEHKDIVGYALRINDHVVFCQAGTSKGMTVGMVTRVLPKTVEIGFTLNGRHRHVFRAPDDVVRV